VAAIVGAALNWSEGLNTMIKSRPDIRRLVAIVFVIALFGAEAASARPDFRTMTCAEAHDLVFKSGDIVATTGASTYQRFVRGRRFCQREEIPRNGTAATSDDPQCPVGYVCIPRQSSDN
jgi:hypothetical protein